MCYQPALSFSTEASGRAKPKISVLAIYLCPSHVLQPVGVSYISAYDDGSVKRCGSYWAPPGRKPFFQRCRIVRNVRPELGGGARSNATASSESNAISARAFLSWSALLKASRSPLIANSSLVRPAFSFISKMASSSQDGHNGPGIRARFSQMPNQPLGLTHTATFLDGVYGGTEQHVAQSSTLWHICAFLGVYGR